MVDVPTSLVWSLTKEALLQCDWTITSIDDDGMEVHARRSATAKERIGRAVKVSMGAPTLLAVGAIAAATDKGRQIRVKVERISGPFVDVSCAIDVFAGRENALTDGDGKDQGNVNEFHDWITARLNHIIARSAAIPPPQWRPRI